MAKSPESRQYQRQIPSQLVYVALEADNGGMVLNLSEQGFGFHAVAPVQPNGNIRFTIELDANRKFEGNGRLEWLDQNRTTAGLQFTEVSEDFRKEIRHWLKAACTIEDRKLPSKSTPVADQPAINAEKKSEAIPSANTDQDAEFPLQNPRAARVEAIQVQAQVRAENAPTKKEDWAGRSQKGISSTFLRNVQRDADRLMSDFESADPESERKLARIRELVQTQTDRIGEALRGAGQASDRLEHLSASVETLQQQKLRSFQSEADALLSRYISQLHQRSEAILKEIDSHASNARSSTGSNPAIGAIMVAGLAIALAVVLGSYHREVGRALGWLGQTMDDQAGPVGERDAEQETSVPQAQTDGGPVLGKQARLLWARVAKGDVSAEVALAKLYLTGEGVAKSCVQARLLLSAAAGDGNVEAQQRLAQLNRKGCP
jgi:TPR repeat protein